MYCFVYSNYYLLMWFLPLVPLHNFILLQCLSHQCGLLWLLQGHCVNVFTLIYLHFRTIVCIYMVLYTLNICPLSLYASLVNYQHWLGPPGQPLYRYGAYTWTTCPGFPFGTIKDYPTLIQLECFKHRITAVVPWAFSHEISLMMAFCELYQSSKA